MYLEETQHVRFNVRCLVKSLALTVCVGFKIFTV